MYTGSMMYFDKRISAYVLFGQWSILTWHLILKTQVKTSTKRVSVGQKWWPNHGTRVEWEYKSSISCTHLCSGDFKRQAFSAFCARVRICFQRLAAWVSPMFSAASGVIRTARGNFIGGNESARAKAKPSTMKWLHVVPPEYYLTATLMENWAD